MTTNNKNQAASDLSVSAGSVTQGGYEPLKDSSSHLCFRSLQINAAFDKDDCVSLMQSGPLELDHMTLDRSEVEWLHKSLGFILQNTKHTDASGKD